MPQQPLFRFPPSITGPYVRRTRRRAKHEWHKGGCVSTSPQFLSRVTHPLSFPSSSHPPPHIQYALSCLAFSQDKRKEAANIFAALRGGEGGTVLLLLGWAQQTQSMCAVYRVRRQGYHSERQNAQGSPSGRCRYQCTAAVQRQH